MDGSWFWCSNAAGCHKHCISGAQNASFNGRRPICLHSWQPAESLRVWKRTKRKKLTELLNPLHSRQDGRCILYALLLQRAAHTTCNCAAPLCQIDTQLIDQKSVGTAVAPASLARWQPAETGGNALAHHWRRALEIQHSRVVSSGYRTHIAHRLESAAHTHSLTRTHTRLRISLLPVFFRSKTFYQAYIQKDPTLFANRSQPANWRPLGKHISD